MQTATGRQRLGTRSNFARARGWTNCLRCAYDVVRLQRTYLRDASGGAGARQVGNKESQHVQIDRCLVLRTSGYFRYSGYSVCASLSHYTRWMLSAGHQSSHLVGVDGTPPSSSSISFGTHTDFSILNMEFSKSCVNEKFAYES